MASQKFDIPESKLKDVKHCVSCDLAWTSRKTPIQKLKHIQTCAKKNSFSEETIKVLLEKQLEQLKPASPPVEDLDDPGTWLEDAIKEDGRGAKKSGPRRQVTATVKSLSETRDGILDRARMIIGDSHQGNTGAVARPEDSEVTDGGNELPPPTQAFGKSVLAQRSNAFSCAFPSTQAFAPSKLSSSSTPLSIAFSGLQQNESHEATVPSTPKFGESALPSVTAASTTKPFVTSTQSDSECDRGSSDSDKGAPLHQSVSKTRLCSNETDDNQVIFVLSSSSSESPLRLHTRRSEGLDSQHRPPKIRSARNSSETVNAPEAPLGGHSLDVQYDSHDYDSWNDDAYLHFIPEQVASASNVEMKKPARKKVPVKQAQESSQTPAQREGRRKQPAEVQAVLGEGKSDISYEEFERNMKDAIRNDRALHQRVLRYEVNVTCTICLFFLKMLTTLVPQISLLILTCSPKSHST